MKSIMIVGVGGQGTLLASKIMGKVFTDLGYDVKVSEVHGMSQRGGSVVTYVKYGEKVFSPLIEEGQADIILSFELLEALRWIKYLKKDGIIITSNQKIDPMPVITGAQEYPEDIEKIISDKVKLKVVPALEQAEKAGSVKAVNTVLLGSFAAVLGVEKEIFEKAIKDIVPERFVQMNLTAFSLGYDL